MPKQARFTQISLFSVLLCGRYDGVVSIADFCSRGTMGIATMEALDGEVMMLDGVVYQARSDGHVYLPSQDETIPFGTIAETLSPEDVSLPALDSYSSFESCMDALFPDMNRPLAVRVTGRFPWMKVRTVRRQAQNGIGLAQAAENEVRFEFIDTTGDLMGFRLPPYLHGVNAPGWHLHYLDAAHEHGGHVVNFSLQEGTVQAAVCSDYQVHLPEQDSVLSGLDLGRDRSADLKKAEAER